MFLKLPESPPEKQCTEVYERVFRQMPAIGAPTPIPLCAAEKILVRFGVLLMLMPTGPLLE